jgi:YD repeat-containing protein
MRWGGFRAGRTRSRRVGRRDPRPPGPTYDALGRATQVTLPGGNTVQTQYNGGVVTVIDQVSRKIKRETDGLGRLVTVTEQDAAGALNQSTNYDYDYLNNLVQVNQGGQYRNSKYDSLGRLLYEKIPEQTATINDGTGVLWTSKFTYTAFNQVATRKDARGAVTTYGYDTMNRLTMISYDVSQAPGVAATPSVNYNYDNSSTSTTRGCCCRSR